MSTAIKGALTTAKDTARDTINSVRKRRNASTGDEGEAPPVRAKDAGADRQAEANDAAASFAAISLLSSNLAQLKHSIFGSISKPDQKYVNLRFAMIAMLLVSVLSQITIMIIKYKMRSLQVFVKRFEDIEYDDDEDQEYIEDRVMRRNQKLRLATKMQDACDYLAFIVGIVNVGISTFSS